MFRVELAPRKPDRRELPERSRRGRLFHRARDRNLRRPRRGRRAPGAFEAHLVEEGAAGAPARRPRARLPGLLDPARFLGFEGSLFELPHGWGGGAGARAYGSESERWHGEAPSTGTGRRHRGRHQSRGRRSRGRAGSKAATSAAMARGPPPADRPSGPRRGVTPPDGLGPGIRPTSAASERPGPRAGCLRLSSRAQSFARSTAS